MVTEIPLDKYGHRNLPVIAGIEGTQAIQYFWSKNACADQSTIIPCPDNYIELISGKPTLLRVYIPFIFNFGGRYIKRIELGGTLEIRDNNGQTWFFNSINTNIVKQGLNQIERGDFSHTLNYLIPGYICKNTLQVTVRVYDVSTGPDAFTFPYTTSLSFIDRLPLQIRLIRIRYRNASRGLDMPAPTIEDFWNTSIFTLKTYPISDIELVGDSEELYDGDFTSLFDYGDAVGTTGSIMTIIDRIKLAEGADGKKKYLALFPGYPANRTNRGWGVAPDRASVEVFFGPGMAHEIGHLCGRQHVACGNPDGPDPNYPYPNGGIGEYGIDVQNQILYNPNVSKDFMSYCLNDAWVSPYTYKALINCFKP